MLGDHREDEHVVAHPLGERPREAAQTSKWLPPDQPSVCRVGGTPNASFDKP
jgi:hypothetical protein